MLTIDANVFVSARVRTEVNYSASALFLDRVAFKAVQVCCPTLVLPETAAAVTRATNRLRLAELAVAQIEAFPNLSLEELTADRAHRSVDAAAARRLRGPDAVCVAVAQEYGTALITWDQEMLTRGAAAVAVMTPSGCLAANPI